MEKTWHCSSSCLSVIQQMICRQKTNHSPSMPIVTFSSSCLNQRSPFRAFLMFGGVMRFLRLSWASFPAIQRISAVRYSSTAARQMELPTPMRMSTVIPFRIRLTLPTGNSSPAREERDFPAPMDDIFAFPPLLRSAFLGGSLFLALCVMLSSEPVLANACESFFFSLLCTGAKAMGTGGGGMLLSKRLSGILATASIMVELLQASLPTLSSVSRMLSEGNIAKTWARQPGSFTTGLLSKSSCKSCLSDLRGVKSLTFSTLLAPSMRVCRCLDPARWIKCSPGMLLNTMSSRMSAGSAGKFSRLTMPQSLSVSI